MRENSTSETILLTALHALTDWEENNCTLDDCLETLREREYPERAAVASLLFEYFRRKGFFDDLIRRHAKKDTVNREMRLLLCCAVTQIFCQTGIAWQSAANIAVDCAKHLRGPGAGAFVNAMLRSIIRDTAVDRAKLPKAFPKELRTRWEKSFGPAQTAEIVREFASNPELTFRGREELTEAELTAVHAVPLSAADFTGPFHFFRTADPAALLASPLLEKGRIYVQDPATALALSLLSTAKVPVAGRVLDACAAPGGKAIMLWDLAADRTTLKLTVSDRSAHRIALMNRNLRKAAVRSRSVEADARAMPFSPASCDLILADVPCTNTGVIRRRPDAPWRFSLNRLRELRGIQRSILESLAKLVRPGGHLLYSTCSLEEEEDSLQVRDFLAAQPEFSLVAERLLTPSPEHDGAYGALLVRSNAAGAGNL